MALLPGLMFQWCSIIITAMHIAYSFNEMINKVDEKCIESLEANGFSVNLRLLCIVISHIKHVFHCSTLALAC